MESCLQSQSVLLPMLYLLACTAYGVLFFHEQDVGISRRIATPMLLFAAVLHAEYLVMMTVVDRHPPMTSVWEFLAVLAFGITVIYLIVERATEEKSTGVVVLPLVTLLLALSSSFIRHDREVPEILRTPWFGAHAATMVLGFAGLALSFTYGILWSLLYRNIKASRFGIVYDRLPALATLFRMQRRALLFGWIALTVSIAIGFVWAARANLTEFHGDPKVLTTVGIWAFYGIGLGVRYVGGRRGTWLTYFTTAGFVLLLLALFAAVTLFPSSHAFG